MRRVRDGNDLILEDELGPAHALPLHTAAFFGRHVILDVIFIFNRRPQRSPQPRAAPRATPASACAAAACALKISI